MNQRATYAWVQQQRYLTGHQSLASYSTWTNTWNYISKWVNDNYVKQGSEYWLRMPAFGNRYIAMYNCDVDGGSNDGASWCDSGGNTITLT